MTKFTIKRLSISNTSDESKDENHNNESIKPLPSPSPEPSKTSLVKPDEAQEEKEEISLERFCDCVGIYYKQMRRNDYYDKYGKGKFTKWFQDQEFNVDSMKDELIDGDMDDCAYLEFDDTFPLSLNIENQVEKQKKQFEIMQYIFKTGKSPKIETKDVLTLIDPDVINFDISIEQENIAKNLYEKQCSRLFDGVHNKSADLTKLLSISYSNNNIPFALWMVDSFMRDSVEWYIKTKNKQILNVMEWTTNSSRYNEGIYDYINKMKQRYSTNGDIVTCIQQGINSYIYRILPRFKFDTFSFIKDDLFQIAHYLEAASQFIMKITRENDDVHAPFQWDFMIAVRDLTDKNGFVVPTDKNDDDVKKDDESIINTEYYDIIGNLNERLELNKCPYYTQEIETQLNRQSQKANLLIRCFKQSYDKFKSKNKLKGNIKDNTLFPRMRRFCTLIDRRKYVTVTQNNSNCELHQKRLNKNGNNNNKDEFQCKYHEKQDRNCDGKKKDDIYWFLPPSNCNSLPSDCKGGYVNEVYFDLINKCLIPRIGYNDDLNNNLEIKTEKEFFHIEDNIGNGKYGDPAKELSPKCKALRSTITNSTRNEGLLTFSFHVQSIDEIRCYFWWKGNVIRFLPKDILNILPLLFQTSYKNNDQFLKNKNINDLVDQIEFKDVYFNKWYNHITNKKNV